MAMDWDKLSAGLDALVAGLLVSQRHGGGAPASGTAGKGFFVSLLNLIIRIWEEKGGSLKDESEMLESMFSTVTMKSDPLTVAERKKVAAVMKVMTLPERNVFRVALFIMDPEVIITETPEKKDKDGKVVIPASKKTEKTGVDPRVNVLRGIAQMVNDDMSNASEIAEMLRGAGVLGKDNKALQLLSKLMAQIGKLITDFFEVSDLKSITPKLVQQKAKELAAWYAIPDPSQPRPKDKAGFLMRLARNATPGAFPNVPREQKKSCWNTAQKTLFVLILIAGLSVTWAVSQILSADQADIINAYQPPAETPAVSSVK